MRNCCCGFDDVDDGDDVAHVLVAVCTAVVGDCDAAAAEVDEAWIDRSNHCGVEENYNAVQTEKKRKGKRRRRGMERSLEVV